MNILRKNTERQHIRSGTGEMWCTFYPSGNPDTAIDDFGCIAILNEYMLPPNGNILSDLTHGTELITYVYNGAVSLEGPEAEAAVITAGGFQYMTVFRGHRQRITNTSHTDPARVLSLHLLIPPAQPDGNRINVQTRFTTAQRHNVLCTVASQDTEKESLCLTTHACVYSSILDPGHHIVYELQQRRKVWLHIINGKVIVNNVDLTGGDGIGISDDSSISLTAKENTELLLIDTLENCR